MQKLTTDPNINSPESAQAALEGKNMHLDGLAKDILLKMSKTDFSPEKQEYNLVRFTVADLGYPDGATTEEIYARAEKLGLNLCPAEVGPQLRLQSSSHEWMLIAMEPIFASGGYPRVFGLDGRGGQLELIARSAEPVMRWRSDSPWVFSARK